MKNFSLLSYKEKIQELGKVIQKNRIDTDPIEVIYLYDEDDLYKEVFNSKDIIKKIQKEINNIFIYSLKGGSRILGPIMIKKIPSEFFGKVSISKSNVFEYSKKATYRIAIYIPDNELILQILLSYINELFFVLNIYNFVFDKTKQKYTIEKESKPEDKCIYDPYFTNNNEYVNLRLCWDFWDTNNEEEFKKILKLAKDRYKRYYDQLDFQNFKNVEKLIEKFLFNKLNEEEKFWHMKAIDFTFIKNNKTKIKFN